MRRFEFFSRESIVVQIIFIFLNSNPKKDYIIIAKEEMQWCKEIGFTGRG